MGYNFGQPAMALACNFALGAAVRQNFVAHTACTTRHRQQLTRIFFLGRYRISVQRERRFMTCTGSVTQELGAKKAERQQRRQEVSVRVASGEGIQDAAQDGEELVLDFDISRLEAYTERVRSEVLCVNALVEDEEDQVIVFKGFSSSLIRPTPDDLLEPVLPPTAVILSIDRMRGPYKPSKPQYIQQGISWQDFQTLLKEKGL